MSSDMWGFVIDAAYCLLECGLWLVNGLPCGGCLGNTRLSSNPLANGESLLASVPLCQWIYVSRITLLYSRWFGRDQIISRQTLPEPASIDPLTASSKSASPPYFWDLVNSVRFTAINVISSNWVPPAMYWCRSALMALTRSSGDPPVF